MNVTSGIPLNVTLHSWPVPQPNNSAQQSGRPLNVSLQIPGAAKNISITGLNATGYAAIEEETSESGLTDMQTLMVAGIATLLPLLLALAIGFAIRFLYIKYKEKKSEGYEGVLQREESSDPLGKSQAHLIPQELKTSESEFTVTPGEQPSPLSPQVLTPKSNGSVITMTLKNNHLIVETEETTDETLDGIKIESQGTTTKYVTCNKTNFQNSDLETGPTTNHGALVHRPDEEPEDEVHRIPYNTGLSQSDLSVSSCGSQNPHYRYGNQTGYDSGGFGYTEYNGYIIEEDEPDTKRINEPLPRPLTRIMLERGDSIISSIDRNHPLLSDVLSSDIDARERIMHQSEEDRKYQAEQVALGNGLGERPRIQLTCEQLKKSLNEIKELQAMNEGNS